MNHHEYVAGFFGVLIGFTLTELIKGVAETFKNLDKVKYYYPHGFFVLFNLILIVLNFFDFYKYFNWVSIWTPLLLMRYTFPSIFVCFFCYILFPSFNSEDQVDFKKHYYKVSPTIFRLGILMIILVLMRNFFFIGHNLLHLANVILYLLLIVSFIALTVRKEWAQYLFLAIALPAITYWTLTLELV